MKKIYITPLTVERIVKLGHIILEGSVQGFDNNPGWSDDDDDDDDPRSKERENDFGSLW